MMGNRDMKRTMLKRTRMKPSRRPSLPKEIRDHFQHVADIGCIVTGSNVVQLHHVHGGSIIEEFGYDWSPGMAQRQNHYLVIPLHPDLHVGSRGIDSGMGQYKGVEAWEAAISKQTDLLRKVRDIIFNRYGYCLYERAGLPTHAA